MRVRGGLHAAWSATTGRLGRLPIRVKLTLAFAGVMVVLLGGLSLALYLRFEAGLDDGISRALQARAADLTTLAREGGGGLASRPPLVESEGAFAQILDADGRVLNATSGLRNRPLLKAGEIALARQRPLQVSRGDASRLLARPVPGGGGAVVVVGESLTQREHALNTLGDLLFIGGPLALLLACAAGYALAAGALSPVESMRRRAADISGGERDVRLPVPASKDELQRLGETLNQMLARVEVALVRERNLVAHASHELRTPLSVLKLELELALAGERTRAEMAEALGSAAEEVDRLTRLASDLLVLARSDQGQLTVRAQPVDVAGVAQAVADRFEPLAREQDRRIAVDATGEVVALADEARVQQALANMVDNALRHGAGRVRLRAEAVAGRVELHVYDEGAGFPRAFLPQAFERFSRADAARSGEGTGLGLSIVEAIAQAHGGRARAENLPGRGAHVWLVLPAAAGADGRGGLAEGGSVLAPSGAGSGG